MGLVRTRYVRAGMEPRPYGLGKAKPESNKNAEGVSPLPVRLLEEMESCFSIDDVSRYLNRRRPSGGRYLVPLVR